MGIERVGLVEDFNRLLIVANPGSTSFQTSRVQAHIRAVQKAYPGDWDMLSTLEDPAASADALRSSLQEGDIVIAAGGDYTVGQAASVLAEPEFQDKDITLLPMAAGNKNDLANSIGNARHSLQTIINHGWNGPVHLIEGQATDTNGKVYLHHAINTAGVGASGVISRLSNEPAYRQAAHNGGLFQKVISDVQVLRGAINHLTPFTIASPGHDQPQLRYEVTLTNSRRVGGRAKPPTEASDKRFYRVELDTKNPLTIGRLIGGLALGSRPKDQERYLHPSDELAFTITDTAGVIANFDGNPVVDATRQPVVFGPGSTFVFRHSANPVQVRQMRPFNG